MSSNEPTKIEEYLKDDDWINAMNENFNDFTRNHVWELFERQKNYNVNGARWYLETNKMEMVLWRKSKQD